MARIAIISPNPASRAWRGRCGQRSRSIRAPRAKCHPPRVSSAADACFRRRALMPVYTVHGPVDSSAGIRATDKFVFVRDGFHFWAALLSPLWLIWHYLWLALIGWILFTIVLDIGITRLGAGRTTVLFADILVALLLGFEAASLQRWTLSRRNWRQLDIVVADDEEQAERRFFGPRAAETHPVVPDQ